MMTSTLAAGAAVRPAAAAAAAADEPAVTLTLSWPGEPAPASPPGHFQGGGSHTVALAGEIDVFLTTRLRNTLAIIAAQSAELTVDVSRLRFIDAGGLGLLALMHRRVIESGGQMSLIGATPRLKHLLHITHLEHLLAEGPAHRTVTF